MERYTGLKWVKRQYLIRQTLNLVSENVSEEVLLTGPNIQIKIPSPSGDCVFGEGELYFLHLMVKG